MRMNAADARVFRELFSRAWDTVVWPYLKIVFGEVGRDPDPDPVRVLRRVLSKNKAALVPVAAVLAGVGGAATGGSIAVATMSFWAGIGYWLGLVALPLFWPVVGALVAAGGVGSAIYALLTKLDATDKLRLAKLYAHASTVVVFNGDDQEPGQSAQLKLFKDRLVAIGVPAESVSDLFRAAPRSVDDFDLDPSNFSPDTMQTVLTEVWLAAETANKADKPEVAESFDRLCARLGIGADAVTLREKAHTITQDAMLRAPAVATAAAYAAPEIWRSAASLFEELLAADFTGNAQRRRAEILEGAATLGAAATAIGAVATGNPQSLAIIAEGYAVTRAALSADPEATSRARGRAIELLSRVGIDLKTADAYLRQIDGVLDDTAEKVEAEAKKKAPEQPTGELA